MTAGGWQRCQLAPALHGRAACLATLHNVAFHVVDPGGAAGLSFSLVIAITAVALPIVVVVPHAVTRQLLQRADRASQFV